MPLDYPSSPHLFTPPLSPSRSLPLSLSLISLLALGALRNIVQIIKHLYLRRPIMTDSHNQLKKLVCATGPDLLTATVSYQHTLTEYPINRQNQHTLARHL